jgi:hypothetical protein
MPHAMDLSLARPMISPRFPAIRLFDMLSPQQLLLT